ncbi:MAG: MBL fold metallo-hydrolase [Clostridia bacterium]|nr:MBL fold metallo-hydrolase [Clostridia bacterium]
MRVHCLYAGSYAANTYLLTDDAGTGAILVDPAISPAAVTARLGALPPVAAIVLTHGHFDHMLTLREWRRLTGAPVAIGAPDAAALTDPHVSCYRTFLGTDTVFAPADRLLSEGDTVAVGTEQLHVLLLPGHTRGSLALDDGTLLLTGDTLFAGGGYGRTDLPGGEPAALVSSLRRLLSLSGERRVLPGHGEESTLSAEKATFYNLM